MYTMTTTINFYPGNHDPLHGELANLCTCRPLVLFSGNNQIPRWLGVSVHSTGAIPARLLQTFTKVGEAILIQSLTSLIHAITLHSRLDPINQSQCLKSWCVKEDRFLLAETVFSHLEAVSKRLPWWPQANVIHHCTERESLVKMDDVTLTTHNDTSLVFTIKRTAQNTTILTQIQEQL